MAARGDIRNWDRALATRCNWSWLSLAWGGTRISPSDIDFVVERRGHFLFIELKPSKGAITRGQDILLSQLSNLGAKITVVYLVGTVDEDHEIAPSAMRVLGNGDWEPVDRSGFLTFCGRWYAEADGRVLA